ncbi:MAG: AMP-binding protein, partial [Halobacteria archaeon]|nr:AMP-binding protein [Halobacteria archaeon]
MNDATPKSYFHRGGTQSLLGATIPEHFAMVAARFPEREAVVCVHQQRRLSYSELAGQVDRLARGLLGIGFNKGDRIGIWSTNNIEWLLLQLATARIGAVLVNINPAYRLRELAYALQRSEVQGLFIIPAFRSSDYVSMLVDLVPELTQAATTPLGNPELPALSRVVIYDPADADNTRRPHPGFSTWPEV